MVERVGAGWLTISRLMRRIPSEAIGTEAQMQASAGVSRMPPRLVKKISLACAEIEPTVLAPETRMPPFSTLFTFSSEASAPFGEERSFCGPVRLSEAVRLLSRPKAT